MELFCQAILSNSNRLIDTIIINIEVAAMLNLIFVSCRIVMLQLKGSACSEWYYGVISEFRVVCCSCVLSPFSAGS